METINTVRQAILLPGAERFRDGNMNATYTAHVQCGERIRHKVYLKHLTDPREIYVECITTILAKALDIPMPDPFLVKAEPSTAPWPTDVVTVAFATADAEHPSLRRKINDPVVLEQLQKWSHAFAAGCFDEWIANCDRHEGNILWDGKDEFVLIDNGLALPKEHIKKPAYEIYDNQLIEQLLKGRENDQLHQIRLRKEANQEHIPRFTRLSIEQLKTASKGEYIPVPEGTADEILAFLTERLNHIEHFIHGKLGFSHSQGQLRGV